LVVYWVLSVVVRRVAMTVSKMAVQMVFQLVVSWVVMTVVKLADLRVE
jgi:hypothetical protein